MAEEGNGNNPSLGSNDNEEQPAPTDVPATLEEPETSSKPKEEEAEAPGVAVAVPMTGDSASDAKNDNEDNENDDDDGSKASQRKSIEQVNFYEEGSEKGSFRVPLRLTKSGRKRATPFPIKLMKVLSEPDNAEILAWTPSGKAFMILQPKEFVAKILPDEFKSAKYSSFTRKLHRWGFMRHYRGPDAGAFFHKHFQKDRMDLAEKMSCYKPVQPPADAATAKPPSFMPEPAPLNGGEDGGGMNAAMANQNPAQQAMVGGVGGDGTHHPAALVAPNFNGMASPFGMPQLTPQQQQQLGGLPPQLQHPQQQQLPQHQQQQQQQPTQQPFNLEGQPDLNAAIELEVARRLNQRINSIGAFAHQPSGAALMLHHHPQQAAAGFPVGFAAAGMYPPNAAGFPKMNPAGNNAMAYPPPGAAANQQQPQQQQQPPAPTQAPQVPAQLPQGFGTAAPPQGFPGMAPFGMFDASMPPAQQQQQQQPPGGPHTTTATTGPAGNASGEGDNKSR